MHHHNQASPQQQQSMNHNHSALFVEFKLDDYDEALRAAQNDDHENTSAYSVHNHMEVDEDESKHSLQPHPQPCSQPQPRGAPISNQTVTFEYVKYNQREKKTETSTLKTLLLINDDGTQKMKYWFDGYKEQKNVSKTWIRRQRIDLLRNILVKIFRYEESDLNSLHRTPVLQLVAAQLGLVIEENDSDDLTMSEMTEIVKELSDYTNPAELLERDPIEVAQSSGTPYDKLLHSIFAVCAPFINAVWYHICGKFLVLSSFKKFDKFIIQMIQNWESWGCHEELLSTLHNIEVALFQSEYPHLLHGLVNSLIFDIQNLFIQQCRKVILRNLYASKSSDNDKVTDYQVFSFGGAAIRGIYKQLYSNKFSESRGDLLSYANKLRGSKTDDIPERLMEENRGHMYIMHQNLISFTKHLLVITKQQVYAEMKITNHVQFKSIRDKIINTELNKAMFCQHYKDEPLQWDFDVDNAKENNVLSELYTMYCKGLINKAIWGILSNTTYKKQSAPLRMQLLCGIVNGPTKNQTQKTFGQ